MSACRVTLDNLSYKKKGKWLHSSQLEIVLAIHSRAIDKHQSNYTCRSMVPPLRSQEYVLKPADRRL